jgi:Ca2+:H+ antiporter
MVVFGWVLDKPLALLFDPFETMVRAEFSSKSMPSDYCYALLTRFFSCLVRKIDTYSSTILTCLAVHMMSYVASDGKSNWLEGTLLICMPFLYTLNIPRFSLNF